jgi:hypothetical protein
VGSNGLRIFKVLCVAGYSLAERFQAISKYTGMQGPALYNTFEYW